MKSSCVLIFALLWGCAGADQEMLDKWGTLGASVPVAMGGGLAVDVGAGVASTLTSAGVLTVAAGVYVLAQSAVAHSRAQRKAKWKEVQRGLQIRELMRQAGRWYEVLATLQWAREHRLQLTKTPISSLQPGYMTVQSRLSVGTVNDNVTVRWVDSKGARRAKSIPMNKTDGGYRIPDAVWATSMSAAPRGRSRARRPHKAPTAGRAMGVKALHILECKCYTRRSARHDWFQVTLAMSQAYDFAVGLREILDDPDYGVGYVSITYLLCNSQPSWFPTYIRSAVLAGGRGKVDFRIEQPYGVGGYLIPESWKEKLWQTMLVAANIGGWEVANIGYDLMFD